jgi:hypothetical protein
MLLRPNLPLGVEDLICLTRARFYLRLGEDDIGTTFRYRSPRPDRVGFREIFFTARRRTKMQSNAIKWVLKYLLFSLLQFRQGFSIVASL